MSAAGLPPACVLLIGALWGTFTGTPVTAPLAALPLACAGACAAWWRRSPGITMLAILAGFAAGGAALAADARVGALHPSLRALLDGELGGFAIETRGPEPDHEPVFVRARLVEDASPREGYVSLRVRAAGVRLRGEWYAVEGGLSLSVSGEAAAERVLEWRAGRTIEAPVTFRRPARFFNEGVADFEREVALNGIALFGSIKSGLLVQLTGRGTALEEAAADVRAYVRRAMDRHVGIHDVVAGGIVTAVLIGDRTGLPDEVRDRLQAAGTYHVIAISGGNIAILAGIVLGGLMLVAIRGRAAACLAIAALLVYSQIATAGPSVWRATLMAVLYLAARLADHRSPPWQAASVAAALMVIARPLDIRDPGFVLTFGATAALLEGARRGHALLPAHPVLAWVVASVTASLAVEITLLPVSAQLFSRVTSAGLVLNLIAVPMMGVAQIAGLAVAALDGAEGAAFIAGWVAYVAAAAIVESARLVDLAPWLAARVPAPGLPLVIAYYGALVAVLALRRRALRAPAVLVAIVCLAAIAGILPRRSPAWPASSGLRLTMFDVGQAEAIVVEAGGRALQIDAGGAPFGSGGANIGARVVAPALWARGLRRLDALLITHGHPDHDGGAPILLADFAVGALWEGIEVPTDDPSRVLRARAARAGVRREWRRAGEAFAWGDARLRVLHPPEPEWERRSVRNDDSVVLEIVYGDVALLLTGDAGAEVERAILPLLTSAAVRVLKVGHHGSRTSSSPALLEVWRPQVALISAGRGNSFGHPAPDVLQRLDAIGAAIYRTDLHGQITLETDGQRVNVRTFFGEEP